jgi:hypothetical protein
MDLRSLIPPSTVGCLLGVIACAPKIGDDCSLSTDCSKNADRLCDTTMPGGYCTIYNCSAGSCPDEAICIAFKSSESTAPACYDPQDSSRLRRTFCMRKCDSRGDCRSQYDCIDMGAANNHWGAQVIENGSVDGHVCAVPFSGMPVGDDVNTAVCVGTDSDFEPHSVWQGVAGSGAGEASGTSAGAGGGSRTAGGISAGAGGAAAGGMSGGEAVGGMSGGEGTAGYAGFGGASSPGGAGSAAGGMSGGAGGAGGEDAGGAGGSTNASG